MRDARIELSPPKQVPLGIPIKIVFSFLPFPRPPYDTERPGRRTAHMNGVLSVTNLLSSSARSFQQKNLFK